MAWAGHPLSSEGIAAHYAGLIDGLVADEAAESVPTRVTDVEMGDHEARRRVAREVLAFAG
jgi:LPPG:FO 2-phospho-L-lactate transferase